MSYTKPNFIVLGVAKSGTTSLHNYLLQHPQVYLTPIKETNYFARNGLQPQHFRPGFKKASTIDVASYVSGPMDKTVHMANVFDEKNYFKLYKNVTNEKAIGEVCTSYFLVDGAIEQIKKELPNTKVLVMLRNPLERAFSGYIMAIKLGQMINTSFREAIEQDRAAKIKGYGITYNFLEASLYAESLKQMQQHFPNEQHKVLLFDDYKSNAQSMLKEVFAFLEVDEDVEIDTSTKSNQGGMPRFKFLNYLLYQSGDIRQFLRKVLPNSLKRKVGNAMYSKSNELKMTAEDKAYLVDYFKEDVAATSKLLKRDLSHWLA